MEVDHAQVESTLKKKFNNDKKLDRYRAHNTIFPNLDCIEEAVVMDQTKA